jgi:hypothetical protein
MQIQYLIVREDDGVIVGSTWRPDPDAGPTYPQGGSPIGGTALVRYGEEFTRAGRADSDEARLVDGVVVWVETRPLAELKAAKNAEINQWRAAANQSTFPFAGKLISCDALSRSDIDAVANHIGLFGEFPDGFPMAWKTADNEYVLLPDVAAFKAMYRAMTAQGTANFDRSETLKRAVGNATDAAEVAAIAW